MYILLKSGHSIGLLILPKYTNSLVIYFVGPMGICF
jgi:hypothetical protein